MAELINSKYKWYIMILGALTNAIVVATPAMGLSVLLPEISKDLGLNIVQAGLVWGISSLPMLFASLTGGTLVDRIGPKRILMASCCLMSLAGAARGFSSNFGLLMITVFIFGSFGPLVTLSNFKNAVLWFTPQERGMANGVATIGMASGFFIGSLVSAAYLSPLVNGWRNVFFVYGAIGVLFTIPWALTQLPPVNRDSIEAELMPRAFKATLLHLASIKNMWLLGLAVMGVTGGLQGLLGYLPLYLQNIGWSVASTGRVLAAFNIASMTCVLPLTILSDKLDSRTKLLIVAALLTALGMGALVLVEQLGVWLIMILVGTTRDGFMAVFFTRVTEEHGVKKAEVGMAIGFVMFFIALGSLIAPPLGNSLENQVLAGAPLIFWSAMALFGGLCLYLVARRETGRVIHPRESLEKV
ncbi:MAG TPA: MFS transporter [Anaerolineales bacterium]|nr:MFS transporter [Anaerolineales bacterium]